MTVDQVIKGLDCCSKLGNLYCSLCPYYGKTFCTSLLKKDAMSVIMQGEKSAAEKALLNFPGYNDLVDILVDLKHYCDGYIVDDELKHRIDDILRFFDVTET